MQITLICPLEESDPHTHSESCFPRELICPLEESDEHTHDESCWASAAVFACTLTEEDGHTHTDECQNVQAICGKEEGEGHLHGEACYEIIVTCPLEEHIHLESCYSDITADIETEEDWEMSLSDMVRGPTLRENIVLVAKSQLGYTESTLNFQVDAEGIRRGITRYGQWYGNPYGDWSAMFASFCLQYAGAEDLPANAGPESMRLEWDSAGLYESASEASPEIGDLVFLSKNSEDRSADSVAIITEINENTLTVIEGDVNNAVEETKYNAADSVVLGYGSIPVEQPLMLMASTTVIANTVSYSKEMFTNDGLFVVYTSANNNNFAFDGNGNAVPIMIDANGNISSDIDDPDTLLWSFTSSGTDTYLIQNVSTGRYMHSYPNDGTGVTTSGAYTSKLVASGSGVKIQSNTEYSQLNENASTFQVTTNEAEASVYSFGMTQRCTIWLDGTDGGLGHLTGSPDTAYAVSAGETFQLPEEWTSPSKYSYKLRGWYDVVNSRYYLPGEEFTVTGNTVLYADWVASSYDIGRFNAQVADSVSTNSFITTYMFDYNYLFNIHSAKAQVTVNASSHSEKWSMVTSGNVAHGDQETKDFIFIDNDSDGLICMPSNRSSHNIYPGEGIVTPGIYSSGLRSLLFSTGNAYDPETETGVLGKTYLGTGDYLFQIMDDPDDPYYGYYYYDSARNAASYNKSNRRFYIYEYLEATSDSIGSSYSDFLPLNSPYTNTNGKTVGSYNYAGIDGEYSGVPHFRYDSKYNSGNHNGVNNVQTDYAYGMRSDIKFYLPNEPGSGGNKDLYGNDMQFRFSGDDDLWVLIDGTLVLDIGGIHGAENGIIDFSTGEVTVQGKAKTSLMDLGIDAGDHTMSVLYLERGSSRSNCSIYFNLAPRFSLQLQKEDVLTQELLNGAEFTVYKDPDCTIPAELWKNEEAYNEDLSDGTLDRSQSTFTTENGKTEFWGLGSGNTYYIKETKAPNHEGYGLASGIIRLKIEREGQATYLADIIPDEDGNEPSNGYTLHNVRIDEKTKTVYLTVTNAPETVTETTTVQVIKKWEDTVDHSKDYILAYLTVTDKEGVIRRIREITLSDENEWTYTWTNLPKYDYDALSEVSYGVEESYESGYYSTVRRITQIEIDNTEWAEAASFINGESYILKNGNRYLSTVSATDAKLTWVSENVAKDSPLANWKATVSNGKVKLVNGANQILSFMYNASANRRYFFATTTSGGTNVVQTLVPEDAGTGFRFYARRNNSNSGTKYYIASSDINANGQFSTETSSSRGLVLTPMKKITSTSIRPVEDWAYQITNTPLSANNETSFAVRKEWDIPAGSDPAVYQEYAVTVQLLANGLNTGRSITLNLKNNWQGSFLGLPYKDTDGNVIVYSVEENWNKPKWTTHYGEIQTSGNTPPTYSTVITNTYRPGGPELPSTGSSARLMYVLCGSAIMLGTLLYAIGLRRKQERRMK
ncbi:MAG: Cna B-type domain-containing protein [Clostridiales bacterium]|nr:Cna B-type domain-containing protein [Clostridiales bacterium]